jgi:hypothetical protein
MDLSRIAQIPTLQKIEIRGMREQFDPRKGYGHDWNNRTEALLVWTEKR